MKVYVVRHGQSLSNLTGLRNGQRDVPLTDKGYKDAAKAGEKIRDVKFDRIFSSDLIRAIETAKTAIPGCSPEQYSDLREIDIGALSGHTAEEGRAMYGEQYDINNKINNFVPFGGENQEMIFNRIASFMKFLEGLNDCENVAVFAHNGSVYCMLRYVLGYPIDRYKVITDNGSVTVFNWDGKVWKLDKFNL